MTDGSAATKVLIMTWGSRGDVQPLTALGVGLQRAGFEISITANVDHVDFISSFGLPAAGVHSSFSEAIEDPRVKAAMMASDTDKAGGLALEAYIREFPAEFDRVCAHAETFRPDLILYGMMVCAHARFLSQHLKVPAAFYTFSVGGTMPLSSQVATQSRERCLHATAQLVNVAGCSSFLLAPSGKMIREKLGADGCAKVGETYPYFGEHLATTVHEWMHPAAFQLVAATPQLHKLPTDVTEAYVERTHVTGWWVVPKVAQEGKAAEGNAHFGGASMGGLTAFISAGNEPPVCIGWGSMLVNSGQYMAELAVRSLMLAGNKRGIVVGGYAKLEDSMLQDASLKEYAEAGNVMFVPSAPHEWLFEQCSVIVHHGGAGTLAASMRSGRPTIVTPCITDQFENALILNRSGCGVGTAAYNKVKVAELGAAIHKCTSDASVVDRAKAMGVVLRKEDGLANTVDVIKRFVTERLQAGKWERDQTAALERRKKKPVSNLGLWCCFCFCCKFKYQ